MIGLGSLGNALLGGWDATCSIASVIQYIKFRVTSEWSAWRLGCRGCKLVSLLQLYNDWFRVTRECSTRRLGCNLFNCFSHTILSLGSLVSGLLGDWDAED